MIAAAPEVLEAYALVEKYHDAGCPLLEDLTLRGTCRCDARYVEWTIRTECPKCEAPPRHKCITSGGNVSTNPHSARWAGAVALSTAERVLLPPKPAVGDERHRRNAARRMHLNDQAVGGPYVLEHDEHRGQFVIIGYKCRTSGRVTLATMKYRAAEEMYWPMFDQARALGEGIVSQMNAINLVLKDPRHV